MFEKNTFVKIFALLVLTLMVWPGLSSAAKTTVGNLLVGQGDYYKVMIDERGQAIVIEELDFKNYGGQNVTELTFRISGRDIRVRYVMQVIAKEASRGNYTYFQNEYVIVPVDEMSDGLYKATLDQSVGKDGSGRIFVYYKAFGYAEKGLLADEFDFETTKWNFDVDYTRVSVSVAGDLILKGGDSKGEYRNTLQAFDSVSAESAKSISSVALDNSMYYVRYDSGFVKQTQGLNPNESFHVCGTYSGSLWMLYLPEILGILVLLAVGSLLWRRYMPKKSETKALVKKGNLNYSRSIANALVAALVYCVFAGLLAAISLKTYWYQTQPALLVIPVGAGLLLPFGLFLYWKNTVGSKEAAITGALEFGFSLILFPLSGLLFFMIVNYLFPPVYYL